MFAADKVQDLMRRLREDIAVLIHSEIDLAKTEVIEKIKMNAKAAALIAAAAPFVLLALVAFLFAAVAALALWVPWWAAGLIAGGALVLIALVFALLGLRSLRKAGMPTPDEAIVEAKATMDDLKEANIA
ncbi:MAG TPA: phage holin family protein [Gaiellales bacterium]|jgi:Flp pilus assembly protein TadB|nr:phage holin family protein [Gaiellales bacterium]